jgi:hypothetical protein
MKRAIRCELGTIVKSSPTDSPPQTDHRNRRFACNDDRVAVCRQTMDTTKRGLTLQRIPARAKLSCRRVDVAIRSTRVTCVAMLMLVSCATIGCDPYGQKIFEDLQRRNNELEAENLRAKERLAKRDAKVASLESQIGHLSAAGDGRTGRPVFEIDRVKILGLTSGVDTDNDDRDDGVAVYFHPMDADGDVLKRAGEIRITLLDNAPKAGPRVLGRLIYNRPDKLRDAWYGKFWTNYYKIFVPFEPNARLTPGQQIDVHLSFVDFLTGATLTARNVVKIDIVLPDDTVIP